MKKDRDLDEIYSETWNRRTERLEKLGQATYEEFLSSDHWARMKEVASGRPNYKKCEFCSCTDVELHHTSYKWIGTKDELRSVISLCRQHHEEVHALAKAQGVSVRLATNELRRKYRPDYRQKNRLPSGAS
ncbi:hypothetical protein SAMD00023378_0342 [Ralstonia sp. NT80]|jgi:hypothetical protein|nr:hypothetical protein SAMD00023378_0342 [Ralstonia sp. NT80]